MRTWFSGTHADEPLPEAFWERLRLHIMTEIVTMADMMGPSLTMIVKDYFMFTVLGALVTPAWTYVFGIGDGVYALNGEVHVLGPFLENSPPYLSYAVTGSTLVQHTPELLRFQVHETIATDTLRSCLIGTDGVKDLMPCTATVSETGEPLAPLAEFWSKGRYVKNADSIRRRLATINRETVQNSKIVGGPLADDTTLVVLLRVPDVEAETEV
jgi:hypothetical protein